MKKKHNKIKRIGKTDEAIQRRPIKSIAIDPGHGGSDPGAIAKDSSNIFQAGSSIAKAGSSIAKAGSREILEKDLNLRLSREIFGQALEAGLDAHLIRDGDYDLTLGRRTELANASGVDLFLSVHHNGAASTKASGTETLYFPGSKTGQTAAETIQKAIVSSLKLPDRGVKTSDRLHVLQATRMAAVLIEPLFLTGDKDRKLLEGESYFKELARAVIAGLVGLVV